MCSKDVQWVWQQILSSDMAARSGCTGHVSSILCISCPPLPPLCCLYRSKNVHFPYFARVKTLFKHLFFLLWVTHFPHMGLLQALYCIVTPVWNEPQNISAPLVIPKTPPLTPCYFEHYQNRREKNVQTHRFFFFIIIIWIVILLSDMMMQCCRLPASWVWSRTWVEKWRKKINKLKMISNFLKVCYRWTAPHGVTHQAHGHTEDTNPSFVCSIIPNHEKRLTIIFILVKAQHTAHMTH